MHFLTNSEIQSTIPPHLQWDTMDKTAEMVMQGSKAALSGA